VKRICDGCRALQWLEYDGYFCDLGYRIKIIEKYSVGNKKIYASIPIEQCPKPRTYKQWFNADFKNGAGGGGGDEHKG